MVELEPIYQNVRKNLPLSNGFPDVWLQCSDYDMQYHEGKAQWLDDRLKIPEYSVVPSYKLVSSCRFTRISCGFDFTLC